MIPDAIRRKWNRQQAETTKIRVKKDVEADIAAIKLQQSELLDQIAERSKAGRPALSILDDKLDALEATLTKMRAELAVVPTEQPMTTKLPPPGKSAIADLVTAFFEEVGQAGSHDYDQLLPLMRLLISGVTVQPLEGSDARNR